MCDTGPDEGSGGKAGLMKKASGKLVFSAAVAAAALNLTGCKAPLPGNGQNKPETAGTEESAAEPETAESEETAAEPETVETASEAEPESEETVAEPEETAESSDEPGFDPSGNNNAPIYGPPEWFGIPAEPAESPKEPAESPEEPSEGPEEPEFDPSENMNEDIYGPPEWFGGPEEAEEEEEDGGELPDFDPGPIQALYGPPPMLEALEVEK